MVFYRSRKLFGRSLAVIVILLSSGCFYSDAPLLTPSEYVQPIRAGLWENTVPVTAREFGEMTPREKTGKHCRTVSAQRYCGQRVRISASSDGSYRLAWEGEKAVDRVVLAAIAANAFIVAQDAGNESAEYALVTQASPGEFMIRMPDCERDSYLRPYAPPAEASSSRCRIVDRRKLLELFTDYMGKSSPADAKRFWRIGD
jgi:hypothetical protein